MMTNTYLVIQLTGAGLNQSVQNGEDRRTNVPGKVANPLSTRKTHHPGLGHHLCQTSHFKNHNKISHQKMLKLIRDSLLLSTQDPPPYMVIFHQQLLPQLLLKVLKPVKVLSSFGTNTEEKTEDHL